MELSYKKHNNKKLFECFSDPSFLNMEDCQNYIPLYNQYFNLNENNYDSINLNNKKNLYSLENKQSENIYEGHYINENEDTISNVDIFFKLSPLIDPYKYLIGKYDLSDNTLFNLPKLGINDCHKRVNNTNNTSYVDSFFSFLSSKLLNDMKFVHGLDFFGSYLGIKNNYIIDVADDIEALTNSDFFYENNNKLYNFLNSEYEDAIQQESRKHKKALHINDDTNNDIGIETLSIETLDIETLNNEPQVLSIETLNIEPSVLGIESLNIESPVLDMSNIKHLESISLDNASEFNIDENDGVAYKKNKFIISCSDSNCSSRSSNTCSDDSDSDTGSGSTLETLSSDDSDEEKVFVSINKFPIQIIAMEKCHNTFDSLLEKTKITHDELSCITIQILMMLITYQKTFDLTHNDLHTNNIMFINTEKVYLYYKINNKHYKIKTYGKIFKIIDFGRAVYRYKDKQICSDSFDVDGDASTQYNFRPFYNENKPLLEPNYSFDLCRLGCSMYDFITEEYDDDDECMCSIHKIIINWCNDDHGNNILYKTSGEERYPDFKLYKMIARKVNKHIPYKELQHKHFNKFVVSRKDIKKGSNIWNIDKLEPEFKMSEHQQMPAVQ